MSLGAQLCEKGFGFLEVSGPKAFREPGIDLCQELARLLALALLLPQPTQAHRCPQLQHLCLLAAGRVQRLLEQPLRFPSDALGLFCRMIAANLGQHELSPQPQELCSIGALAMLLAERLGEGSEPRCDLPHTLIRLGEEGIIARQTGAHAAAPRFAEALLDLGDPRLALSTLDQGPALQHQTGEMTDLQTLPGRTKHDGIGQRAHARQVATQLIEHGAQVLPPDEMIGRDELLGELEPISEKVLTQTLRAMERDGLIHRQVHAEVPPRVDYALTPLGATLAAPMKALGTWSLARGQHVEAARERFDMRRAIQQQQARRAAA